MARAAVRRLWKSESEACSEGQGDGEKERGSGCSQSAKFRLEKAGVEMGF